MHSWWVVDAWNHSPAYLIAWVFWILLSITLHELGHGWAAIRQGDRTPIVTGHMTWNPIVHMGMPSLIMFALIGIAWGAMPVNPGAFRGRYGGALVALAGPAMNVFLAAVSYVFVAILLKVVFQGDPRAALASPGFMFAFLGLQLNILLCLFNLLPVPPLDGSRILADLLPAYRRLIHGQQGPMISLVGLILLFSVLGDKISDFAGELGLRLILLIL